MATIKDIIAYFCIKYPHPSELSKARLTKMVYLADWRSALKRNKQMTAVKWIFNHYGPYVDDIYNEISKDSLFEIYSSLNIHGGNKETISIKNDKYIPQLTNAEKEILDHVINITAPKYWNTFMELVYSTYPIRNSNRYDVLDLLSFAAMYKENKEFA